MAISRAQIEDQIAMLSNGGTAPAEQTAAAAYTDALSQLSRTPVSYTDVNHRAHALVKYFPTQRRMSLYDLASSVAKGLAQNAQSGRPTALGYGLGMGFDLFTQEARRRQDEADKIKRELSLMARQEVEKEKAADIAIQEAGIEAAFKLKLEELKNVGTGVFQGKGELASALNFILRAEQDVALKNTPEYRIALLVANRPREQVIQTETGSKVITVPGLDITGALRAPPAVSTQSAPVPDGYTDTGQVTQDGKRILRDPDGNLVKES